MTTNTSLQDKKALVEQLLLQAQKQKSKTFPLSYGQKELWLFQQRFPQSTCYNIRINIDLHFPVEVVLIEQAAQLLINRHAILRSKYTRENNQLVQRIPVFEKVQVTFIDISDSPTQLQEQLDSITSKPFDLEKSVYQVYLFKLNATHFIVSWVIHHIVLDYRSIKLFSDEFIKIVRAKQDNKVLEVVDDSANYFDFVDYQAQYVNSLKGSAAKQFWQQKLEGIDGILNLPTDKPYPTTLTTKGASVKFDIPKDLRLQIDVLTSDRGVTVNAMFVFAYQLLLYHYTNQADFLIAVTADQRPGQGYDYVVGDFISMLPIRSFIQPESKVEALLMQCQNSLLDAYEFQDYPYSAILESVSYKKVSNRSPLTQVWFNYLSKHFKLGEEQPSLSKPIQVQMQQESGVVELLLEVVDFGENESRVSIKYSTDLFEKSTIIRMGENYLTILKSLVGHSTTTRVKELIYMSETEKQQVLFGFNNTKQLCQKDKCIHTLFEEQAESTPHKTAIICNGTTLTYRELEERSNQLAHFLCKKGAGADTLIGLAIDRSVEMVVAMLGILKAGAAYLPIDPEYPQERTNYMLEQSNAAILVTQSHLVNSFSASVNAICIDTDWETISSCSTQAPQVSVTAHNLVYTIFTSGSTGKPKGVMITHQNLHNFLHAMSQKPGLEAADNLLAVTSLSFDIAGLEIWLPLLKGACCIIATVTQSKNPAVLSSLIQEHKVTMMQATPATWRLLIEDGWDGKTDLKILCGGEPLPKQLAAKLLTKSKKLWNMYGPTETTVWSSIWQVNNVEEPILIGKPIANTQLYVLDEDLLPVPIGVTGELYIGGDGVAKGYMNRPDLTAARFVSNPFSDDSSNMIYKTGDSVRWRADGNLEIFGRLDDQVKVRGFRIELGEIENALARYKNIKQAVVIVDEDHLDEKRLSAFFIPVQQGSITSDMLLNYLHHVLPNYMIPSRFIELEHLPLTLNGKIDRKALSALKTQPAKITRTQPLDIEPKSEIEKLIKDIWQEILEVDTIGLNDNFFDLGGHSLLLIHVHHALQEKLERSFPMMMLFQHTTIHKLAQYLSTDKEEEVELQDTSTTTNNRNARSAALRDRRNRRARGAD